MLSIKVAEQAVILVGRVISGSQSSKYLYCNNQVNSSLFLLFQSLLAHHLTFHWKYACLDWCSIHHSNQNVLVVFSWSLLTSKTILVYYYQTGLEVPQWNWCDFYINRQPSSLEFLCVTQSKRSHLKSPSYDDAIKWKHFPRYWPFVLGIDRSPMNSPHKGFDVFFDLRLNQQLSKQWIRRGFETPPRSLWRHCSEPRFRYTSPTERHAPVWGSRKLPYKNLSAGAPQT